MTAKEAIELLPVVRAEVWKENSDLRKAQDYMERHGFFDQERLDEAYVMVVDLWKSLRGCAKIASNPY